MKLIALAALAALSVGCKSVSESSPVVLHVEFDGHGDLVTDLGQAVVLGQATGFYELRTKSSHLPLMERQEFSQDGDLTYIAENPETGKTESHHHAFGSGFELPEGARRMFPAWLLAKYPLLRFSGEADPAQ